MSIDLIINNNQLQLCNNLHERDHVSFIQSIISVILLSLICLLGIIGNSLVIIVYCIKPKHYTNRYMMNHHTIINSNHTTTTNNNNNPLDTKMTKKFGTHSISLKSYKLPLYKNKLNQHNLILLLAFIDLFTCVFILPWDIYRVANYAYDETIPNLSINNDNNNNNNLNENNSSGYHIDINSNKGIYINYQLNMILTLLRNIIFACEGSVLTAIAFERYMILVKQDLCKSSICCHHLLNNNNNNITSLIHKVPSINHTNHNLNHSNKLTPSSILMNVTNQKDKNHQLCSSNKCITLILIIVIIGTCLFECILIILELMKWNCQLTEQLRELINQIYILLTFISFIIITYLYVRIFRTVRENDLRKQQWLTTIDHHHNTNYTSMKLMNKSNSLLQSSIYNNEIEPVLKLTNEHDTNSIVMFKDPKIHYCDTTQSRRYGLPFRLMKQLSCDQVITKQSQQQQQQREPPPPPQQQQQEPPPTPPQQQVEQCNHQHQLQTTIQWNILKRRILLKTPSISRLFEQKSNKSMISKHNNQSTGTTTTTIPSPISPLSVNRLLSKRVTRSHRTGLMIFISTVIFYATLFPVLWVHFKFWWKYTITAIPTTTANTNITTITNYSTNQLHNRTKFIFNNQENDGSFMTTVHHEFYYVNNAVNFFIYSLFNQSFRERLKRLLAKY